MHMAVGVKIVIQKSYFVNPFPIFAVSMETIKKDIRALTKEELRDFFVKEGDKAFRGNQVYEWLWSKGAHSFEDMTNISKETREMLQENFVINHIKVDQMQRSEDGTVKNAVRLHDGLIVESVLIPTAKRTTACVSSQVGCSLDCKFSGWTNKFIFQPYEFSIANCMVTNFYTPKSTLLMMFSTFAGHAFTK